MEAKRVVLCDDHEIVREAIKARMQNSSVVEIVGEAGDGREVVDVVKQLDPDVLIIDVELPKRDGIEATKDVLRARPRTKVIIFTAHAQPDLLALALRAGASGYVLKSAPAEDIAKADFGGLAQLSTLATWSPDPTKAPNYVDTGLKPDGTIDPLVNAKLSANSILAMVPQYLPALRKMEAISLEVGTKEFLLSDNEALNAELTQYGVTHGWETYDGDHGSKIKERIRSKLLPFFAAHLDK